jgi:flagellar basal body-associated protein FliL
MQDPVSTAGAEKLAGNRKASAVADGTAATPSPGGRVGRLIALLRRERAFTLGLVVLLLTGIGFGIYGVGGERSPSVTVGLGGPLIYKPLPEIFADLKSSGKRTNHIKLVVVVQVPTEHAPALAAKEAAIIHAIQARLRDTAAAEIAGGPGVEHLRQMILGAVNQEIAPAQARQVLFTQMLVD